MFGQSLKTSHRIWKRILELFHLGCLIGPALQSAGSIIRNPIGLQQSGNHLGGQLAALIPLEGRQAGEIAIPAALAHVSNPFAQTGNPVQSLLAPLVEELGLANGVELAIERLGILLRAVFEAQLPQHLRIDLLLPPDLGIERVDATHFQIGVLIPAQRLLKLVELAGIILETLELPRGIEWERNRRHAILHSLRIEVLKIHRIEHRIGALWHALATSYLLTRQLLELKAEVGVLGLVE